MKEIFSMLIKLDMQKITLSNVLDIIGNNDLSWSILDIEVVLKKNSNYDVFELEKKTFQEEGYMLSWEELAKLATAIDDTHNILIVSFLTINKFLIKNLDEESIMRLSEIVIEGFDSTYWNIHIKQIDIYQKLQEKFSEFKF